MTSRLYSSALASLDPAEARALAALQAKLGGSTSINGPRLVENLMAEAHLVGDEVFGHPAELAAFLRAFCSHPAPRSAETCYSQTCEAHQLQGLRIPDRHLPPQLLRYVTSRALIGRIIEVLLGKSARVDFDQDLFVEDTLADLAAAWDPALLHGIPLNSSGPVFATFEHGGGPARSDARALAEALALPWLSNPAVGGEALLLELRYPSAEVAEVRFPTVADAGTTHLFRPAKDQEPADGDPSTCYGWTEPFGAHPPQPELVHASAPASILDAPPRFVGRVPL